jgi:hypothetical protein
LPLRAFQASKQPSLTCDLILAPTNPLVAVMLVDQTEPLQANGQVGDVHLGFLGLPVRVPPLQEIEPALGFTDQPGGPCLTASPSGANARSTLGVVGFRDRQFSMRLVTVPCFSNFRRAFSYSLWLFSMVAASRVA